MNKNAIDSKSAGQRNEKLVIALLREKGSLSQAQICENIGLQSSTVSYIVGRLREKQLIIEQVGQSAKRGAKPTVIKINPNGQFIVGVEINPSYILAGLFNFSSESIDNIKVPLDSERTVENVISLLEINIKGLLSKNDIPDDKLIGIGVTLSGSISKQGVVQLSSPLGWKNVPLKKLFSDKFECPVDIYTTKVRLLAEMNIEPRLSSQNIVYLNVANGVGSTIVIDGRLIHGSTNRCGELGHIVIDSNGPICGCGQKGCLEAHISSPAIAAKIRNDISNGVKTILSEQIDDTDIPEEVIKKWSIAAGQGDKYALSIRDFIADKLSGSAVMAINLYDPDIIILAGYVNDANADYFAKAIKSRFATDVYDESSRNIEIIPARIKEQALIRGVVAAVLQKEFET